jgi:hypothetical protein
MQRTRHFAGRLRLLVCSEAALRGAASALCGAALHGFLGLRYALGDCRLSRQYILCASRAAPAAERSK